MSAAGHGAGKPAPRGRQLAILTLGAIGIVYGDIGTSPLYALRECFHGPHGIEATPDNILGVLSLIFWSLTLVVSIKYLTFVMRADNGGEGGVLALMALVSRQDDATRKSRARLIALGLFGAALLSGEGMITPAISVLSAVEGLTIATPVFQPYVVAITIGILVGLFVIQARGTGMVGAMFGPIMVVWFVTIAALGLSWLLLNPHVVVAFNPAHAVSFFIRNGGHGFIVLGSVFLVVTGCEALYADMGHFGRRPIRLAWFALAFPALLLNYLGQGAMLLIKPEAAASPFYLMAPSWALVPLVVLAMMAAVIASQALISGVFSLTHQAIQLGYCPRMGIAHTSASQRGQIYIPQVNWMLMIATVSLVLFFRSSSALAAAYGIAVSSTMVITTMLTYLVARGSWGASRPVAGSLAALFLFIEFGFLAANLSKIAEGGWFPLATGVLLYLTLSTWKQGRALLASRFVERLYPLEEFLTSIAAKPPHRVAGAAVFMTSNGDGTPPTLLHNLEHNKILHERVILLTVVTVDGPTVAPEHRVTVTPLRLGFFRVRVCYGFIEDPDVPAALDQAVFAGGPLVPADTTYFLGTETLLATKRPGLPIWRERLFVLMSRNALRATTFFRIHPSASSRSACRSNFKTEVPHGGSSRRFLTGVPHEGSMWHEPCFVSALMVYSYRELVAWQLSVELRDKVLSLLKSGPAVRDFKFRDQLADSVRSTPRNVAEGFGRYNPGEIAHFLGIARASLDETETSLRDGVVSNYFPAETVGPLIRLLARCRICVNRLQAYELKAQLDPRFKKKRAKNRRSEPS